MNWTSLNNLNRMIFRVVRQWIRFWPISMESSFHWQMRCRSPIVDYLRRFGQVRWISEKPTLRICVPTWWWWLCVLVVLSIRIWHVCRSGYRWWEIEMRFVTVSSWLISLQHSPIHWKPWFSVLLPFLSSLTILMESDCYQCSDAVCSSYLVFWLSHPPYQKKVSLCWRNRYCRCPRESLGNGVIFWWQVILLVRTRGRCNTDGMIQYTRSLRERYCSRVFESLYSCQQSARVYCNQDSSGEFRSLSKE